MLLELVVVGLSLIAAPISAYVLHRSHSAKLTVVAGAVEAVSQQILNDKKLTDKALQELKTSLDSASDKLHQRHDDHSSKLTEFVDAMKDHTANVVKATVQEKIGMSRAVCDECKNVVAKFEKVGNRTLCVNCLRKVK